MNMLGIARTLFSDLENNGSRPPTDHPLSPASSGNNKENILFRGLLQSIMVKGGCHKDQSGDLHKYYGMRWSRAEWW